MTDTLDRLKEHLNDLSKGGVTDSFIVIAIAEIERLWGRLELEKDHLKQLIPEHKAAKAEIERLRAEVARMHGVDASMQKKDAEIASQSQQMDVYEAEAEDNRAEIERLRARLELDESLPKLNPGLLLSKIKERLRRAAEGVKDE